MDLTASIVPNSSQLNAEDLLAGPITVTITDVTTGSVEQPFNINLAEFPGRPYRPSKSMRRILVVAWGAEASVYASRRLTLYRNPEIMFGGVKVGGIEISAMSHIDKPVMVALTVTRGRRKDFKVQPLETPKGRNWISELDIAGSNIEAVTALGTAAKAAHADDATLAAIRARYAELKPA